MLVRDIIVDYIKDKQDEADKRYTERVQEHGEPKLHPSSLWFCQRKAILTAVDKFPDHPLHAEKTHPHTFYLKEKFDSGNVWENEHANALAPHGQHKCTLSTEYWAGEADFLIEDNGTPVLVEYKDTAAYNFWGKRKDGGYRIPYEFHAAQIASYRILWNRMNGTFPEARLYYHGRDHWAEFRVWDTFDVINYEGEVDGKTRSGFVEFDVETEMAALETYWQHQSLPEKYNTPTERRFGGCTRTSRSKTYVSCPWFGYCWPEWPLEGRRLVRT